jgi:hypothetical protein
MDRSHDWVAARNSAQGASILGSSALPVFIADSMDFVIVGRRPSRRMSSVLMRSLSRNPARSRLSDRLSVIIVRVTPATAMSHRFGFLRNILQRYFSGDYEKHGVPAPTMQTSFADRQTSKSHPHSILGVFFPAIRS